jgi:hypothetical protein
MALIVRIVLLIDAEHLLETAFIKRAVVGDQRQPLDQRLDLLLYIGEPRCVFRVPPGPY